jgi:hypothetical protein
VADVPVLVGLEVVDQDLAVAVEVGQADPGVQRRVLQRGVLVNLQLLQFDQVLPALTTGALDASWNIDPFTTQSVTQGIAAKIGDAGEILGPQQSTVSPSVRSPT